MGKDTISSQELSDYTHINSTQIRRDLSGFGKFGKRGVGYNVESLVEEIRKILRTAGQHNIALFGAGNLGQAIASSDIFADHGFRIVAMFDVDPDRDRHGGSAGSRSADFDEHRRRGRGASRSSSASSPCPPTRRRRSPTGWSKAGVKIIFNYSERLLQVPPDVTVHTSSPAVDLLYALYFYLT